MTRMNDTTLSPQVRIKEIAFTGYPVTDLARARAFYENLLGLVPSMTLDHEGKGWIEYEVGSSTVAITNMDPEHWKPSADGPSLAFEVEDFDSAMQAMRNAGVLISVEPLELPTCRFAVVADPDGNSVAIHQRRQAGILPM
jgi:predicted enzyme related to lactoylglutathione lyase